MDCKELKSTGELSTGSTICGGFSGSTTIKMLRPISKEKPSSKLKVAGVMFITEEEEPQSAPITSSNLLSFVIGPESVCGFEGRLNMVEYSTESPFC